MTESESPRHRDLFEEHAHAPECAYCPVCSAIAVLKARRPEVLEHLAAAARELMAAAAIVLEEAQEVVGSEDDRPATRAKSKMRRVDLS